MFDNKRPSKLKNKKNFLFLDITSLRNVNNAPINLTNLLKPYRNCDRKLYQYAGLAAFIAVLKMELEWCCLLYTSRCV